MGIKSKLGIVKNFALRNGLVELGLKKNENISLNSMSELDVNIEQNNSVPTRKLYRNKRKSIYKKSISPRFDKENIEVKPLIFERATMDEN